MRLLPCPASWLLVDLHPGVSFGRLRPLLREGERAFWLSYSEGLGGLNGWGDHLVISLRIISLLRLLLLLLLRLLLVMLLLIKLGGIGPCESAR